jgi:hypothetical protein
MALFTDGTITTLEDLRGYESEIYNLAATENIDLSQKAVLAQQELEMELTARFFRDDPAGLRRAVVTPALRLWHTFHTLELAFRDAYNSHLNDRYQGKWKEYERQARRAYDNLLASGVGMAANPVPKAPAPQVAASPGVPSAGGIYWVRAAWVNAAGEAGCASDAAAIETEAGWGIAAYIAEPAPEGVAGWNVYAGASAAATLQQNAAPLALGATWVLPESGPGNGAPAGQGQAPSSYQRFERVFRRG